MHKYKGELINLLWITLGCLIYAVGLNLFLIPIGLYTTGLMGLSQILSTVLNSIVTVGDATGAIYFILNIPIILLGWFKVGKKFTLRTFWAVLFISLFQSIVPTDTVLIDDQLLAVITSGLLIGAGIGLTLKFGASTGGSDIIALYISLFKGKSFGMYNIMLNIVVIAGAMIVTQDVTIAVLMVVSLYTIGVVIDKIHNTHEKLTMLIMTSKPDEVTKSLLKETARGVTIIDSRGGMTGRKNYTVVITISKSQRYLGLAAIKEADEKAFINILPVENVVGFFPNLYEEIL